MLDCVGGQALQEGPWTGAGWLIPLVGSNILDRELRESTVQVFWGKKRSMHGLGLGNSKLCLVPGSTSSDMTEVGPGTWSVNRPQWKPFSSQDFLAVTP